MNTDLPDELVAYKQTPVFDEQTLPAGLRRAHSTKAGVWGVIHILEGELTYRTLDPVTERPVTEKIVDKTSPRIIIRPQELHEVAPRGRVLFYVEFYAKRTPST